MKAKKAIEMSESRLDELEDELLAYDNKIKFCKKKLEELKEERFLVILALADAILEYEKEIRNERREEKTD